MDNWQERQNEAIADQKARHAAVANGSDPVPAADDGPLATYNRAQTLDYLAQLTKVSADGEHLPNASGPGLTILPGTPRNALTGDDAEQYAKEIEQLTAAGEYTPDEIAAALAALAANIANGVTLDPATAES